MIHTTGRGSPARAIGLLAVAVTVASVRGAPAGAGGVDTAALDRFVEERRRAAGIPGVALVVVGADGVVHEAGFGWEAGGGPRISAHSTFLLGSATKTLTALAIAQLVDRGVLRFDDPVQRHLPRFMLRDPRAARGITVRHLLTHTSGLSQWSGHDLRAQREARFDHIAPVRPPGAAFEYSSLNYIVLGQLLEARSGRPFAQYLREEVFEPLDMGSCRAGPDEAGRPRPVRGSWSLFGLAVPGREPAVPAPLVPAGFVACSARDLGHYLAMLLGGGRFGGRDVLSPVILREVLTPWDGNATGPAMAWGVGPTMIAHAGNTRTFSARLALLPREGHGVAVLANVNSGPFLAATADILSGVVRVLRGEGAGAIYPRERLLKVGILIVLLFDLARLARALRLWGRRGFPARLVRRRAALAPLVVESLAAAFVVLALPRWIGVPLRVILEYFPDLGLAIVVGVASGLARGLATALVRSASAPA